MSGRVVAIDFGMVRIGIAASDATKMLASAVAVIPAEKRMDKSVDSVKKRLEAYSAEKSCTIETIIVGLPLLMSGKSGLMADEVRHFIALLEKACLNIPVMAWDERLTSVQVERVMREANISRKKRTKYVDTLSAVVILQSYLDSLNI